MARAKARNAHGQKKVEKFDLCYMRQILNVDCWLLQDAVDHLGWLKKIFLDQK